MANVLTVTGFVLLWVLSQAAGMVFAAALFPQVVSRARHQIETRPWRNLLTGLLFWAVSLFLLVTLLQAKAGGAQLIGWLAAGPALAASLLGGAGLAELVAGRFADRSPGSSHLKRLGLAGLAVALAGLIPLIGWFVVLPLSGWICTGAGIRAILNRRRQTAPSEEAELAAPAEGDGNPRPQESAGAAASRPGHSYAGTHS